VDVPAATYPNRTRVPISATVLSGSNPAAGASVTFRLVRPGNKVTTQTMTTGADGKATWSYRVNGTGTYSVTATATYGGQTSPVSNTDTFTVN
jgi:predicted secreted protein